MRSRETDVDSSKVRRIVKIWSDASSSGDDEEEDDEYLVKSVEREVPISDALFQVLSEHKAKALSDARVRRENPSISPSIFVAEFV